MFFLLPLIGAAVGATVTALVIDAIDEEDRQKSKHHREIANDLSSKYSSLEKKYNEYADKSKQQIEALTIQHSLDEADKDFLRLALRLQQGLCALMFDIDNKPTSQALAEFEKAVLATNTVLSELKEELIQVPEKYFSRNLKRIAEGSDVRKLSKPKLLSTIRYGSQISIKTYNGRYVTSDLENYGKLSTKAEHLGEWERFEIIDATDPFSNDKERAVRYGDKIAFRAIANSKFVCSDLTNYGKLSASAPHVKEWETFVLFPSYKSSEKMSQELKYGSTFTLHVHNNQQVIFSIYGWTCIVSPRNDIAGIFVFTKPQ
jgi:hypothetical protein